MAKILGVVISQGPPLYLGYKYGRDPLSRKIVEIKEVEKYGEMAYVSWYALIDKDGATIAELRGGNLESIIYDKEETNDV
jgi:hypothetical protein